SSLAGFNGLPRDLAVPPDPEGTGRRKGWIDQQLRSVKRNRAYKETVDQPLFSERMDLSLCRANSRSFRKLCKELAARMPPLPVGEETPPADAPEPPPATEPPPAGGSKGYR